MSHKTFTPDGSVIVLDADISNKITVHAHLVLDTGATFVVLPRRIIRALEIQIDPDSLIMMSTASTVESTLLVILPKVQVLGKTVYNVHCLMKDLPPESGVDGLLGLSFLRHFKLSVDFVHGKLTLTR